MNKKALAGLTIATLAIALGCARQGESDDVAADADRTSEVAEAGDTAESQAARDAELQESLPPPKLAGVQITVNLSPAAKAAFASNGETILVDAVYGGDPTQAGQSRTNELGVVELGRVKREVKDGEVLSLSEDVINQSLLPLTIGQPQLMVNVTSGRKTTRDNLLSCAFYWDTLSVAGESGVVIPCQLLSEVAE